MSEIITYLKIRVIPGAKANKIDGMNPENALKLRVTAKPLEGKANDAVVELLSDFLGLKKSDVLIKSGFKSRNKTVVIYGLNSEEIHKNLLNIKSHDP